MKKTKALPGKSHSNKTKNLYSFKELWQISFEKRQHGKYEKAISEKRKYK